MTIGKLCLAAFLAAIPTVAAAQPSVNVGVNVNVGAESYDTVAPGDPVESVDVFYDQLSPYGVWVDEPDVGRVFIPETASYVPYTVGHWQYTSVGFVWVSAEPFGWATSHYGRWAYSNHYGRWYWLPDTAWGPAWVEWREAGDDFGWAPLPPDVVVRIGWQPPVESWHYCRAEHVLDANLNRYYEPRERVVEIHRAARPMEHYSTISNVKVVVGPPAATLREHRVAVRPVKVEARTIGRWTAGEAHVQVERAREHRATFEVQNQHRIESNPKLHEAHVKVIEAHPQIKAQVDARVHGAVQPGEPNRTRPEPNGRPEPARTPNQRPTEPNARPEPTRTPNQRPTEPSRPAPMHAAPGQRPAEPARPAPSRPEPEHAAPKPEERTPAQRPAQPTERTPAPRTPEPRGREQRPNEPNPREHAAPTPPANRTPAPPTEPTRAPEPRAPERAQPQRPEPPRAQPPRAEPQRAQPPRAEPQRPEPPRAEPQRAEPPRAPERKQPERKEPERKDDRKEPDHR